MANPPIFYPTFHGQVPQVRAILRADPTALHARDAKDLTPLHVAAKRGQAAVAELLLAQGADVHGPTHGGGWTPIVHAAYRGHLEVVRLLIERGADVTEAGGDPIHFAGQRGHRAVCKLLVEHGAIDALVGEDGDARALFRAAHSFDAEGVDAQLAATPSLVDRRDARGRSALHEVCTYGDLATAKVLLARGADRTLVDANGETPLDRAERHRKRRLVALLRR
ncbi:MAG: ankyrin repeat domain-containing protein [Sandaracinaceae bacterium]|nr:ankyrin repeat domain-containing protein [Sandaracinaceae bacterium]